MLALFLFIKQEREIITVLSKFGKNDLSNKKILDVGCGNGGVLRDFVRYGAKPENCYGIDLLFERIELAKKLNPSINFECSNAENLPYDNKMFDIVLCFTVFSLIFDGKMKWNIAREMLRVLNNDGVILYYDFHMDNPRNPDVRGVKKWEIYSLFPDCRIYLKRVTLAPPIVRFIALKSFLLSYFLEKIPWLRTHYLGIIRQGDV